MNKYIIKFNHDFEQDDYGYTEVIGEFESKELAESYLNVIGYELVDGIYVESYMERKSEAHIHRCNPVNKVTLEKSIINLNHKKELEQLKLESSLITINKKYIVNDKIFKEENIKGKFKVQDIIEEALGKGFKLENGQLIKDFKNLIEIISF